MKKKVNVKNIVILHSLLLIYSLSGVFSKLASKVPFLSFRFCVYYGIIVLLLGIYAIVWQQIIKNMPLTSAYANKAITVVWGILWGYLFFKEKISIGNIIGAIIIIIGIVIYSTSDKEDLNE